jgi:polysaccharide export outer membrane protein
MAFSPRPWLKFDTATVEIADMKRPLLALTAALAGCSSAPPFDAQAVVQEWVAYMNQDHTLVPGDVIDVAATQNPDLTQRVVVSAEGAVSLRRLEHPVQGAGKTMAQFRQDVQEAYGRAQNPGEISVTLNQPSLKTVYVIGEVEDSGPVPWHEQMTLAKAVAAAGYVKVTAKPSDIYITRADAVTRKPKQYRVNLKEVLVGKEPDFLLLPGDVVYVQTSVGGDVAYFVDLWVRRVLPIEGVGGLLGAIAFAQNN